MEFFILHLVMLLLLNSVNLLFISFILLYLHFIIRIQHMLVFHTQTQNFASVTNNALQSHLVQENRECGSSSQCCRWNFRNRVTILLLFINLHVYVLINLLALAQVTIVVLLQHLKILSSFEFGWWYLVVFLHNWLMSFKNFNWILQNWSLKWFIIVLLLLILIRVRFLPVLLLELKWKYFIFYHEMYL